MRRRLGGGGKQGGWVRWAGRWNLTTNRSFGHHRRSGGGRLWYVICIIYIIYHHLGMGDHLICAGLVRRLALDYALLMVVVHAPYLASFQVLRVCGAGVCS